MDGALETKTAGVKHSLIFRLHTSGMTMSPIMPAPSSATAVSAVLQQVHTTVAVAQGLAGTGRTIDLAGLEAATGMLCAKVLDLPPAEGAALRPALTDLELKLSVLAGLIAGTSR